MSTRDNSAAPARSDAPKASALRWTGLTIAALLAACAAPLPPLLSTASAEASTPVRRSSRVRLIEAVELAHEPEHAAMAVFVEAAVRSEKPQQDVVRIGQKPAPQLAAKPDETKPA